MRDPSVASFCTRRYSVGIHRTCTAGYRGASAPLQGRTGHHAHPNLWSPWLHRLRVSQEIPTMSRYHASLHDCVDPGVSNQSCAKHLPRSLHSPQDAWVSGGAVYHILALLRFADTCHIPISNTQGERNLGRIATSNGYELEQLLWFP